MSLLSQVSCTELRAGESSASAGEIAELHPFVPAWSIVAEGDAQKLRNTFVFDDEGSAKPFVRLVEELARKEGHSPRIEHSGTRVTITWWTPSVQGLHPNDFIMAGKTDGAYTLVLVGALGDMVTQEPLPKLTDLPRFRHVLSGRGQPREEGPG